MPGETRCILLWQSTRRPPVRAASHTPRLSPERPARAHETKNGLGRGHLSPEIDLGHIGAEDAVLEDPVRNDA